jgi:putative oxidoreductase
MVLPAAKRASRLMNALIKLADRLYSLFLRCANALQSPLLLALRLYWGWQFLESGIEHLSNMTNFVTFMSDHGVPAPWLNAHFVATLEAGGGILLILGLASRLIAVPLTINMIVAYVTADRDNLAAIFTDHAEDFYKALPFSFLLVSVIILVFGPGLFSLDTLVKRYWTKRQKTSVASAP